MIGNDDDVDACLINMRIRRKRHRMLGGNDDYNIMLLISL